MELSAVLVIPIEVMQRKGEGRDGRREQSAVSEGLTREGAAAAEERGRGEAQGPDRPKGLRKLAAGRGTGQSLVVSRFSRVGRRHRDASTVAIQNSKHVIVLARRGNEARVTRVHVVRARRGEP